MDMQRTLGAAGQPSSGWMHLTFAMRSIAKVLVEKPSFWLCLLIAISVLAYVPGISGSFLFDDFPNIVTNPKTHAKSLGLDSLIAAARAYEPGPYGRPLATIGFAIDHYIGNGQPLIFKLHSLLIHLLNACLVFALARHLLRITRIRTHPSQAAVLGSACLLALAWSIHPLQVSTVLYVVQRMEMLATSFVLLSLLAYIHGRERQIAGRRGGWPSLALAALLVAIGLLAKESAVAAPLIALALEVCIFGFRAHGRFTRRALILLYALGAVVAVSGLAVVSLHYLQDYVVREFTALDRLLSQSRVLVLYLSQIMLPVPSRMPFYYDNYAYSTGLFQPWTTAACTLSLIIIAGLAVALRRRMPLVALGVFWFFGAHALTSGVLPLELVYEHRNYLALFGPLLVVYALGTEIKPRLSTPAVARSATVALILGMLALTTIRSMTWGDPLVLATDMVANNPASARASNDLATLYFSAAEGDPESKEWRLAIQEFRRGAALPGSSPLPEHGLILMNASVGLPAETEWWDGLLQKLRSRPISPQESMAVTGLIAQRQRGFDLDDQRLSEAYRILTSRAELSAYDYCNIGDHALNQLHDHAYGTEMFLTCARKAGHEPEFLARTIGILQQEGHHAVADALIRSIEQTQE